QLLQGQGNLDAFFDNPRVQALVKPPGRLFRWKRKPSYISSRVFALTLLDTFAPPHGAAHSEDLIARAHRPLPPLARALVRRGDGPRQRLVQASSAADPVPRRDCPDGGDER